MSNFVSLTRSVPDSVFDRISQVAIPPGAQPATVRVGLWGYYDAGTGAELQVRVVSGPGDARATKETRGPAVRVYSLVGITEASVIQAFLSDGRPWTAPLAVVRLAGIPAMKRNEALLASSDPAIRAVNLYACRSAAFRVRTVPVPVNGNLGSTRRRGLAIHVTAGEGTAETVVNRVWGTSGVNAHFVIERNGDIAQCMALTLRGEAQGGPGTVGDPNADWLSVELVCAMNNAGTDGYFTGAQISAARQLFFDLSNMYGFQRGLASPLVNDQTDYAAISKALVAQYNLTPARDYGEAQDSEGLSCHRWLNKGHACPGLIGLRMMPVFAGLVDSSADFEF
jgi:hypothetical protein